MLSESNEIEPDWDCELALLLTPRGIIHALFSSAHTVHTGWESCADPEAVLVEIQTGPDDAESYCRMMEQEFLDEESPDQPPWHDWMIEIVIGEVIVSAHWQVPLDAPPMEWEWCGRECEKAFSRACVLFGKRVRRGLAVEDPPLDVLPKDPITRH